MVRFHQFFVLQIQFEADRRAFTITLNSFGTELSKGDRETLYPTCGKLYPEGLRLLAQAEDFEQMKMVADNYGVRGDPSFLKCLRYSITCTLEGTRQIYTSDLQQLCCL